ncbi:hypothetical protein [Cecembia rubra]|uniref:Nuclear transport factor 2 family protein n=1 Tax=Cecembia rubra TaxID=1485585 RepID=A0A2P8E1Q7_9BACT|nr:hypothetical protein [Cecembia rubra]PSL03410.1 hypothetical protein CLV48_107128 [Cecembia rubra]
MTARQIMTTATLLLLTSNIWGQSVAEVDSLKLMKKVKNIFKLFNQPNYSDFKKISTDEIYCIICSDQQKSVEEPYIFSRKSFFDNHLTSINSSDNFIRATKSSTVKLIKENAKMTDITVLFTIYQRDELAPGHEGGQLGIYFKKVKDDYKFAGIETIP